MAEPQLSRAELFDVFSNARRRMAVRYLASQNGACDLSSVVEQVAAWENDVEATDVTRPQRRRVYISLYQTHLPMLADHGIVDWDPEAHRIELECNKRRFEPYLGRLDDGRRTWARTYAALTTGAVVSVSAVFLIAGPNSSTLLALATMAFASLFLIAATVHRLSLRGYLPQ